jgi:hypothetical protein
MELILKGKEKLMFLHFDVLILEVDFYDKLVEDGQVIEVIGGRLDVFVDK